jgi:hypothetical protein
MHRLEYVKMGKNALAGALPDVFDRLHYLGKAPAVGDGKASQHINHSPGADLTVELDLHKNAIIGTLPASLGESTTLGKSVTDCAATVIGRRPS